MSRSSFCTVVLNISTVLLPKVPQKHQWDNSLCLWRTANSNQKKNNIANTWILEGRTTNTHNHIVKMQQFK